MAGAVAGYMLERAIERVDDFDGSDESEELMAKIIGRRVLELELAYFGGVEDAEGVLVAAHFYARSAPLASDVGEERLGDVLVDEHSVEGVADAVFASLGVVHHTDRLLDVG